MLKRLVYLALILSCVSLAGFDLMVNAESERCKFFGPVGIVCHRDSIEIFHYGSMGHIRGIRKKIVGDKMYLSVKSSSFSRRGILPKPKPFESHILIPTSVNQVLLNKEKTIVWDRDTDS